MLSIPGKIPIRVSPVFWLLIAIIGWSSSGTITGTAVWAVVIFFSVLIHEYGHALTALAFGQQAHIELVGFGGLTHREGPKLKLWQDFLIVLNGPLAGFLLFGICYYGLQAYGVNAPPSIFKYGLMIAVQANLFWTVVNLLPVHPLDGGKLLNIILEATLGMRGVKIAYFLSAVFAVAISILFFLMQAFLAGAIFLMFAFESYRAWKHSLTVSVKDHDNELQLLLKQAEEDLREGRQSDAEEKLEFIRKSTGSGVLYVAATEYLATLLNHQGLFREAYALLASLKGKISPEALRLSQQTAYRSGAWQEAITIGNRAYQTYPGYDVALINAFCYGLLGEAQPAVGWIQRAVSDGLPNLKVILHKEEFDKIRNSAPFLNLVQKYSL